MKRIIIVYNPRSSSFVRVQTEVLEKARALKGVLIGKYEVEPTNVDTNAAKLAQIIAEGDLVVSAGGDATACIAANGVMLAGKPGVRVGFCGFGNFNDVARCFGNLKFDEIVAGEAREMWPLDCQVNGQHWRYGMCYFTAGMSAESCGVFEEAKMRTRLRKGGAKLTLSLWALVCWWFREHKREFVPEFELGNSSGEFIPVQATDYMAINGKSVGRIIRGGNYYLSECSFWSMRAQLDRFWRIARAVLGGMTTHLKGEESDCDILRFKTIENELTVQTEGEFVKLKNVRNIVVRKAATSLMVVMK